MNVYEVKLTHQAEIQLYDIARYIAVELSNPYAADDLTDAFEMTFNNLSENPEKNPPVYFEPWRSMGIRWVKVGHYIVYFWIDIENAKVQVMGIAYARMDQEKFLDKMMIEE